MYCRGIRGATTVEHNEREEILEATRELLQRIIERNEIEKETVTCAIFTVTQELDAEFPALAARQLGWTEIALMSAREIPVPNSLANVIRVLVLVNTTRGISEMQHVYIRDAIVLRPDFGIES